MIKYIYWLIFRKKVRGLPKYKNPPPPPPPQLVPFALPIKKSNFQKRLDKKIKENKGVNQPIIDRTTIPPNK
jgi:hypothetical protein